MNLVSLNLDSQRQKTSKLSTNYSSRRTNRPLLTALILANSSKKLATNSTDYSLTMNRLISDSRHSRMTSKSNVETNRNSSVRKRNLEARLPIKDRKNGSHLLKFLTKKLKISSSRVGSQERNLERKLPNWKALSA